MGDRVIIAILVVLIVAALVALVAVGIQAVRLTVSTAEGRRPTHGGHIDIENEMTAFIESASRTDTEAAFRGIGVISLGQVGFQKAGIRDADGDGVGDYGTLAELSEPDNARMPPFFIEKSLGSGQKHSYLFVVKVQLGSATTEPAYTCTATPVSGSGRTFFVDETRIIRYSDNGVATSSSPEYR